ncbi:MAG: MBL fold metallo-hydrolase [Chloroflexota bacterium]
MEIVPGVYRVEGIAGSNAVLLAGEQMAVVDTGFPGNGEAIVGYIKSIGRSPRDLRWIINTHHHFDHSGSADELHQLTGASIVAHRDEVVPAKDGRTLLRKGVEGEPIPIWYRWLFHGHRPGAPDRPIHDTVVHEMVGHGDRMEVLGGLRFLHTPGHTPGSLTLVLEGQQMLFLGDSVINNVNRLSRPLMWDRKKRRQLDASLRSLRELDAEVACFGHGPPLQELVMERVRSLTDRPYDLPTWQIVLKNWRTLRKFYRMNRQRRGVPEGAGS